MLHVESSFRYLCTLFYHNIFELVDTIKNGLVNITQSNQNDTIGIEYRWYIYVSIKYRSQCVFFLNLQSVEKFEQKTNNYFLPDENCVFFCMKKNYICIVIDTLGIVIATDQLVKHNIITRAGLKYTTFIYRNIIKFLSVAI